MMMDEETIRTIKMSVQAATGQSMLLSHAFCLLAQMSGVDLQALMERIRTLETPEGDDVLQKTFEIAKKSLLDMLAEQGQ